MELRTDHNLTTLDSTATLEDVYDLHDVSSDGDAGAGVTVAVMDTGVDPTHPVFDGTELDRHDFTGDGEGDAVGHGTAVAGTIARIAPDATIVSLRIFGDAGRTSVSPIAGAYDWLTDHADEVDVCNFSWGAQSDVEGIDRLHREAMDAGIQDVVAAGNTGSSGGSPATAPGAFSAGAVTEDGTLARFSSYDPNRDNPDVAALGRNVRLPRAAGTSLGHVLDDEWVKASGTSFSAAITTGLVARYLSTEGGNVVHTFQSTARDVPGTPADGAGIVDYGRATRSGTEAPTASAMTWDFLGTDVIHISADWFDTADYTAVRVDEQTIKLLPADST